MVQATLRGGDELTLKGEATYSFVFKPSEGPAEAQQPQRAGTPVPEEAPAPAAPSSEPAATGARHTGARANTGPAADTLLHLPARQHRPSLQTSTPGAEASIAHPAGPGADGAAEALPAAEQPDDEPCTIACATAADVDMQPADMDVAGAPDAATAAPQTGYRSTEAAPAAAANPAARELSPAGGDAEEVDQVRLAEHSTC